jgi:AcrR family transcriptional regulator
VASTKARPKKSDDTGSERQPTTPRAKEAVRRALAARESAYTDEVQRLLDAGLEVMRTSEGAPRVTDIVRTAGLSNAAFYRHFPSKDDLVAAVVEAGSYRLAEYAAHQMEKATSAEDKVAAWITCVFSQASNRRVADDTRAVMRARSLPGGSSSTTPRPLMIEDLLVDPIKELGSVDPARDAATINRVVFGRLQDFLWAEEPAQAALDHLIAFCLAAVRR